MDTNAIGARTEGMVMAALLRSNRTVLTPFGVQRYDLVFEDEAGFHTVQCKTGRLIRGAITFDACSQHSRTHQKTSYRGKVDFFGVYYHGNEQCYLVPVEQVATRVGTLRLEPAKNRQVKGVRLAEDFLI